MTHDAQARSSALVSSTFFIATTLMALPLWLVRYAPIQDLPQHLAAIRVLHSYADPAFGFAQHFELTLLRTQYLLYYAAAHLLSFVFELEVANKLLVTAAIVGTPYAVRSLLRALGRDERLAFFALPLAYNAHLILGFVNFLLAIPLALYGVSLAVRQRRSPKRARALGLALVALACFYAHVVPFSLLCTGVLLVALGRELRAVVQRLLPLLPAGIASLLWVAQSPAGQATLTAARGSEGVKRPVFQSADLLWRDLPNWLTDVLHGDEDLQLLQALGALMLATFVAGTITLLVRRTPAGFDPLARSLCVRLSLLPVLAAGLYFVAPTSYDWIWPIAQRFPLLALLFLVPVLPAPPRALLGVLTFGVVIVAGLQGRQVTAAFRDFETHEVKDFDRALSHLPERSRVAGLIFQRHSRYVKFSPFIHFVAYQQARSGGVVMFTFADFPQSPFRFREDDRPPRVPPRWEWTPERVRPGDLRYYDYVLARGGPGALLRDRRHYAAVYRGDAWSVWKRLR